jgi:crotonobetaine/carnitine-CoA ligase
MSTTLRHSDRYRNYDIRRLTIGNVLAEKADRMGDRTFLTWLPDGRRFSFREVHQLSNALANGLLGLGVGKSAHVALLMENCPEQVLSSFALGKLGAVAVPINAASRGEHLHYFLEQSDAQALIIESRFLDRILAIGAERLPALKLIVIVNDGSDVCLPESSWRSVSFESLLQSIDTPPPVEVSFRDRAMIMYTSGTTGPSKGCVFSQVRSLLWGMSHAEAHGYRPNDVFYVCMPLFHVSALQGTLYNALTLESSIVLQRRFSASGFWKDVLESGATVANMVGSMANILWGKPPSEEDTRHRLRLCHMSPCPEFALGFEERFNLRIVSGYGLTDYWSTHAFTLSDPVWKLGSAGRTRRGIEARVVDLDDFDVPAGESGELILRNNNPWETGEGYYKMPEASLQSFRNGWFHTGDQVRIDPDGYMWFVGRTKDSIRRRGENISSFEIETVVKKHPAIADAAAYPVRSSLGEDDVALAVITRDEQSLSDVDLIQYCATHLPYFMVPRYIRRMTEFPRTHSFKVQKFILQAESEKDPGDLWDREAAGIRIER